MTQNFNPTISKRLWWCPKPFFYTAILGLAFSFQMSIMLSPAHAIKKYSKDNGNIPCSSCHSRTGLSNGTMYPLTGTGSYFKTNGTLPPRAAPRPTAPPVYQQPQPQQPVYPQPTQQQPVYPQQPQQPPVYPQPQQPVYPQQPQPQQPVYPRQPQQPVYPQPARNPHVDYCRRKYRSYNVRTDTFRGYDGIVRRCISPSSRGQQPVRPRPYNPPRANPRPYNPPRVNPRPYTPPPRVRNPVRQSGNYSCGQAKRLIRNQGYRNVTASNCGGVRYTFFGYRGGARYRLRIRASDGVIYKVQRK